MTSNIFRSRITAIILFIALVMALAVFSSASAQSNQNTSYEFTYQIDRTAVGNVASNDLTLIIQVGQASSIAVVDTEGEPVPFAFSEEAGAVTVTTSSSEITLSFEIAIEPNDIELGLVSKATLRDGKPWAWSHSFDGTQNLEPSIALFSDRDWQATVFVVGELADTPPDESYLTKERLSELVTLGWSLGNQTFDDDECQPIVGGEETAIIRGQQTLTEIIELSSRPEYTPLAFAPPCSLVSYLNPFNNIAITGETSLRLFENGGRIPVIVDDGASEQFFLDNKFAFPYDAAEPIGRDKLIDLGEIDRAIELFDWISQNSVNEETNQHMWHNTVTQGGSEESLGIILSYVYNTYGPFGNDEVWMAPSDVVLSYLIVRENSRILITSGKRNNIPLPVGQVNELQQLSLATPTPTATPSSTPTASATPTTTPTFTPQPSITPSPTVTKTPTPTATPILEEVPEPTSETGTVLLVLIGVLIGVGLILLLVLVGILVLYLRNDD